MKKKEAAAKAEEQSKKLYINRELSWLQFNLRVLMQADSPEVPLLERLRFCAIYTSNLDEFFMVRAGSLHDRSLLSVQPIDDKTGMNASEQLKELYLTVHMQYPIRDRIYHKLSDEMAAKKIVYPKWSKLDKGEKNKVEKFFDSEIVPVLRPYMLDVSHPFPHLENKQLHILLCLKNRSSEKLHGDRLAYAIIPVPREVPTYWSELKTDEAGEFTELKYLPTEQIILRFAAKLYTKYSIKAKLLFKVTRNADLEFDSEEFDEVGDNQEYPKYIKNLLKKRERLSPVRLEYHYSNKPDTAKLIEFLQRRLSLQKSETYCVHSPLSYEYASDLIKDASQLVKDGIYKPIPQLRAYTGPSVFAGIEDHDILLNYPYHSILTYIDFLREAVYDDEVESIKITLYRLSRYSEIISLLKYASERGKSVVAVVELKARFDEENNIHWAKALEDSGCKVYYGFGNLKVHSKVTLITKKYGDYTERFVHIATGNYNEQTSKQYTDLGILTKDNEICDDVEKLFYGIEQGVLFDDYKRLLVSPTCLKQSILNEIKRESERGENGRICMKMNSLTDKDVIDSLIEASRSGVKILLIIRGICCLRAGIEGFTDNIKVISIVGRYLEHSRIYSFGCGSIAKRVYIGSADMMTRNTTRRIEVMTPILDPKLRDKLQDIIELELRDNVKACEMQPDGSYKKVESRDAACDSQIEMYKLYK